MDVIEHYDKLIEENNDPVYDTKPMKEYMDQWDGQVLIDAIELNRTKNVLEIGVGTGRIAIKTVPLCKKFYGIDISPKTIERAKHNLSIYQNIELICDDFMQLNFSVCFDAVYSSLTFMHIEEKQKCINRIYSLLNPSGRFVLSIDKNQNKYIDYGSRKLEIYPDSPADMKNCIKKSGLTLLDCIETEFAHIFVCTKE